MINDPKEIGQRLVGLRDALDLIPEVFAESCGIPLDEYLKFESGEKDMSISILRRIASTYNLDVSVLMFDEEPRMNSYFVTRKGKGLGVKRVKDYQYQTLTGNFNNRKADIFEVTIEPKKRLNIHHSSHIGQEFNLVIEGKVLIQISGKDIILEEGDSIYFDSSLPHGMKALDEKPAKFIAVVL